MPNDSVKHLFPTPISDRAAYVIEVDGQDFKVVPYEVAENLEYRMNSARGELDQIERWNDCDLDEPEDYKNWDKAMALLHNRHSKADLTRLIADLLSGETPKVLK